MQDPFEILAVKEWKVPNSLTSVVQESVTLVCYRKRQIYLSALYIILRNIPWVLSYVLSTPPSKRPDFTITKPGNILPTRSLSRLSRGAYCLNELPTVCLHRNHTSLALLLAQSSKYEALLGEGAKSIVY
jgi:hypothetical protein